MPAKAGIQRDPTEYTEIRIVCEADTDVGDAVDCHSEHV